jgi:hypothetical protein
MNAGDASEVPRRRDDLRQNSTVLLAKIGRTDVVTLIVMGERDSGKLSST